MKLKLRSTLVKVVPVVTTAFLLSCSESPKESEGIINDESIVKETTKEQQESIGSEEVSKEESLNEIIEETEVVEDETKVEEIPTVVEKKIEKDSKEVITEVLVSGIDHSTWNDLLNKHVSSSGKVNYKGIKADKVKLESYLTTLKTNSPKSDWTKNQKLAYWINVYNAFTVKLIVDNYPLKSITDLDKPWDKKWIEIGGKTYSLGNVENDILRKMRESRIHFAINCASFSCPNLLNEAFTADKLSSQLRKVTKDFFEDETKNDLTDGDLKVSKLFEWYAADFSNGDIVAYINKYSGKTVSADSKVSYLEYSWKLNE